MTEHKPHPLSGEESLIELALESWKLEKLSRRLLSKLEMDEQKKYVNKIAYFETRLSEILQGAGLTLVTLQGEEYDPGMAVTVLNMGDFSNFSPDDALLIEQMLEPIIMGRDGVKKTGTVFVGKAH